MSNTFNYFILQSSKYNYRKLLEKQWVKEAVWCFELRKSCGCGGSLDYFCSMCQRTNKGLSLARLNQLKARSNDQVWVGMEASPQDSRLCWDLMVFPVQQGSQSSPWKLEGVLLQRVGVSRVWLLHLARPGPRERPLWSLTFRDRLLFLQYRGWAFPSNAFLILSPPSPENPGLRYSHRGTLRLSGK